MSIKAFPLNQQEYPYNAQDVMKYYAGRNSGVFETGDNLKVSANEGLQLRVNTGMGWLSKDYVASVAFWNESVEYLMVDAGHDTHDRIDLVVVSWNFIQQEQNPTLIIRKGTPASSPTVPSLVNDSSTIEIALARINVGRGAITLSDSDIVDLRGDDEYCPLVYDEKRIKEQFDTKASKAEVDFERKRIDNLLTINLSFCLSLKVFDFVLLYCIYSFKFCNFRFPCSGLRIDSCSEGGVCFCPCRSLGIDVLLEGVISRLSCR